MRTTPFYVRQFPVKAVRICPGVGRFFRRFARLRSGFSPVSELALLFGTREPLGGSLHQGRAGEVPGASPRLHGDVPVAIAPDLGGGVAEVIHVGERLPFEQKGKARFVWSLRSGTEIQHKNRLSRSSGREVRIRATFFVCSLF